MAKALKAAAGFGDRLKKMEKMWEQTSEAAGGGGGVNANVENGKREARLVEAKIVEVKDGSKLMIQWTWDCLDVGDKATRTKTPDFGYVVTRDGLDTEQNLGHMKRKLKFFGFDHTQVKAAELEAALEMITKGHPLVNIRVYLSSDEQWQNVQLLGNEVLGWEASPFEEAAAEEGGGASHLPELDTLDRNGLKKFIAANKVAVKVMTNMTDDDIRAAIREAVPVAEEEVAVEEEAPAEEEPVEEEAAAIEAGSLVLYTPPRAKAALTCEVLDVDAKGTAKLKNTASGKQLVGRVALDQLELAAVEEPAEEPVEEEPAAEEEAVTGEEEFGTVKKGSKVECAIKGKGYKGVVTVEPTADAETLAVKFDEGPYKGKTMKIPVENVEPLE